MAKTYTSAEFRKLTPVEREEWNQQKSRERLLRFVDNVQREADELAAKKGLSDWAASASWRCITDAPAGAVIGPAEPSDELNDILWLMFNLDLMRGVLAHGQLEEAVMAAYDVGRGAQLVGLRAGRKEGGKASGETRRENRLALEALVPELYEKFHREDPAAKETVKYSRIRAALKAAKKSNPGARCFKTGLSDRNLRDILNNPSK